MPLPDLFAAFRWWLVLMMLGAAATPLAFTLLQRLPDKGYAFSKMLGLLLVSYLFWLLGSLGIVGNNLGGILLALGGLLAASLWAYRHAPGRGCSPGCAITSATSSSPKASSCSSSPSGPGCGRKTRPLWPPKSQWSSPS